MSVTGNDLLALGLPDGPTFAAALAEANRLSLSGAALEIFVRAMLPSQTPEKMVSFPEISRRG